MSMNPFENDGAPYYVLRNSEDQCSLWPASIQVPEGWRTVHGADTRSACLEYIKTHWTDMRPASLIKAMEDG